MLFRSFVLRSLDLSHVEPIAAVSGPLLYWSVEKLSDWRARGQDWMPKGGPEPRARYQVIRNAGLVTIVAGLFLFAQD